MSTAVNQIITQVFDMRNEYLVNGKVWIYAIENNQVKGIVAIERLDCEFAWINDLFIEPKSRQQGLATRLVREAEEYIRLLHAHCGVSAGISKENEASRNLFKSLGYKYVYDYEVDGPDMYSKVFQ